VRGSRNKGFFRQAARTLGRRRVCTPVSVGASLGRYEIRSQIGEGGMGEVYRARDEKLNRDVAIKVLPASFSQDADRLRRFEQEAQAAGTSNHPNILAVYDDAALFKRQSFPEYRTLIT